MLLGNEMSCACMDILQGHRDAGIMESKTHAGPASLITPGKFTSLLYLGYADLANLSFMYLTY